MDLEKLMQFAVEHGASDLHIQAGAPPMVRISGQPHFIDGPALTGEETRQFVAAIAPRHRANDLDAAIVQGIDFSHNVRTALAVTHLDKLLEIHPSFEDARKRLRNAT